MTAYCEPEDLLIGQIATRLPPSISLADMIEAASDEIDAKLGFMYVVPFREPTAEPPLAGEMLPQQFKLIKDITRKLASGRIILAVTAHTDNTTVHAYGYSLIQDATQSLLLIANGDVRLNVVRVDPDGDPITDAPSPEDNDPYAFIPGAWNRDAVSPTEAFEENFMGQHARTRTTRTWFPGG